MSVSQGETKRTAEFESEIVNTPAEPGVYFFWNEKMECLYIGKATNIRQRLHEHLTSYRECERMRNDVDYDDSEMTKFAIERFADQLIHAYMDEVWTVTTKEVGSDGLREKLEKRFIQSLLPEYNENYNHVETDSDLKLACPECGNRLQYMKSAGRYGGYVCKNFQCRHYWKLDKGDVVEVVSG